ncbi:hypothetical protein Ddc_12987 [Ditylenchus destructor]|nr:hypothetical protein Ddc_12987 [Ditylenchus destructor]
MEKKTELCPQAVICIEEWGEGADLENGPSLEPIMPQAMGTEREERNSDHFTNSPSLIPHTGCQVTVKCPAGEDLPCQHFTRTGE